MNVYQATQWWREVITAKVNLSVDDEILGPVYTKRQCQGCDNSVMTLAILFLLKTMESLQIGIAIHFQATPLLSMRTVLLV